MYLHSLAARLVIPEPVIQIILLMPTCPIPWSRLLKPNIRMIWMDLFKSTDNMTRVARIILRSWGASCENSEG